MNNSRENILLTSLALFLQKSFKEVTMMDIVEKTGMSKGAFYHYFNSKEQVFSEVIRHFFTDGMSVGYKDFSTTSLREFYTDLLRQARTDRAVFLKKLRLRSDELFSTNYFYLIFDAMRLLPGFKEQHQKARRKEIKAWKNIINTARRNNEIKTAMNDEQVARLFIYLGDGTNINLVINDELHTNRNELGKAWDGLYDTLKTRS